MSDSTPQTWTQVIRAERRWLDIGLGELWRYRTLARMFVRRDFVSAYKQTVLGPIWFLVGPVGSSIVFTIVFGRVIGIPTGGIPAFLFYFSGMTCWTYLSSCVSGTAGSFGANAGLFGKVYFPRLIAPVATVASNLLGFGIQLVALGVLTAVFAARGANVHTGVTLFLLPVLVVQIAFLGLGVGLTVASLTVKYRDVAYLLGFGMQLWLYASPIIYPLSQVPDRYRFWYQLNPMAAIVSVFRSAVFGVDLPEPRFVAVSWGVTAAFLSIGVILYSRTARISTDVV